MGSILVGLLFYVFAFEHLKAKEWMVSNKYRDKLPADKRKMYQRSLVLPFSLLGTWMIVMGVVERLGWLQTSHFALIYALVGAGLLLFTHKRTKRVKRTIQ